MKKEIKKNLLVFTLECLVWVVAILVIRSDHAYARDLVAASNTAAVTIKRIAQGMSVIGVVSGGALMQIPGVAEFGKRTLAAGLIGCLCSFGAPAFLSLMTTIFGNG